MKTSVKVALAATGLVVALLVAAFVTVINLEPNNHKPWIAEQFSAQTGRDLTTSQDAAASHAGEPGRSTDQSGIAADS